MFDPISRLELRAFHVVERLVDEEGLLDHRADGGGEVPQVAVELLVALPTKRKTQRGKRGLPQLKAVHSIWVTGTLTPPMECPEKLSWVLWSSRFERLGKVGTNFFAGLSILVGSGTLPTKNGVRKGTGDLVVDMDRQASPERLWVVLRAAEKPPKQKESTTGSWLYLESP